MPRSSRSLREILQHRQITGFVGRTAQLALYRANLRLPVDDERRSFVFSVHGDGGVGKSFLLGRMRQGAAEEGWLTAVVDESYDVPEAMAAIARQFEDQGVRLKRFGQRYAAYRKRSSPADAEPSGTEQVASLATQTAVRVGLSAARAIPVGGMVADAVKPDDAAQRLDNLRADTARKLRNRDDPLAATPVDGLTRQFVDDLGRIDRPIALFFDTYERSAAYLDDWLRGVLDGRWGEPATDIVVAVAGRFPLDPSRWSAYLGVRVDLPLSPFTETEARQLLAQQDITDERVIAAIMGAADGLPLSLAMLAATRPSDPAAVGDVTGSVVERFLQWEPDAELQELALTAALPRHVDQDVLAAMSASLEPATAYGWLTVQPFVARSAGRCHYHDIVRGPMLRLYRTRSARRWRDQHAALAAAYHQWRNEMAGDAREWELWRQPAWQENLFEETYHRLCADPKGALPEALEHAVSACRYAAPTARLAETIAQAGRDAGADDLLDLGERLLAALTAEDDERIAYLDVILRRPEATSSTRANAVRERGRQHRFAGRYDEALADAGRALTLRPEYQDAFVTRGETYRLMGRYPEALVDFDRAADLDPGDSEAFARRGETYRNLGRYDESVADLDRAIGLDPDQDWILAERGETYRLMDRHPEALVDFDRAIERDPENAWAIGSRAQSYRALGRYDDALADLDRAIELDPDYAWMIGERGEIHRFLGRYAEAVADFDRAVELDPEYAWAIAHRGGTYWLMDRDDEALADLDRAIELDPDYAWAIGSRGQTYRDLGRYADALADLDHAVRLRSEYAWALAERGETYRLMDRHTEALADFDRAIELDADSAWAIVSRAQTRQAMGHYDAALGDFSRAIEVKPDYAWAIAQRGETCRLMDRQAEALADFGRAIELDPDYAWAIGSRGQVYRAMRRYDDALADLDRAVELAPESDWVRAERARVLRRLGRDEAARADLDRAIELDPRDLAGRAERALVGTPGTDRYQCVMDLEAAPEQVPALAAAITEWLVAERIVGPDRSDTLPGLGEYAPGPAAGTTVTEPFPGDAACGFAMVERPDAIPSLPARSASCPSCSAAAALRDAFTEDVIDALLVEGEAGAGGLRCPACGQTNAVRSWTYDPPWAFGNLALGFWNWPPLSPDFVDAVAQRLGHRVALVTGTL